jgi:transglutaminase-like putative cysteine protease
LNCQPAFERDRALPLHHSTWVDQIQFVDHRALDWERVRRVRYFCYQRFYYEYPGPVRNLRHHLIVVPGERYGDQELLDHRFTVTPYPAAARPRTDEFGNCVWDFDIAYFDHNIAFEAIMTVERTTGAARPRVPRDQADRFLQPSALTASDPLIEDVARELNAGCADSFELAERISGWVAGALRYASGATSVSTTAAQALTIGQGLCQDYSHVMLAICRAAGLPARYVSGHMLGEGGSHAWVEVLLPTADALDYEAVGFDPANRRRPNLGYTTVAIGRDYRDVPPTSGRFTASYNGRLTSSKRAGLTMVELVDGEIISA